MIPVRCFSCGKLVSAYFDEFQKRTADGEDPKKVLDDLGVTKYCCRRMLIAHLNSYHNIFSSKNKYSFIKINHKNS